MGVIMSFGSITWALRKGDIRGSLVLMTGMSMLYSLLMRTEESEYWYRELENYGRGGHGDERRERFLWVE